MTEAEILRKALADILKALDEHVERPHLGALKAGLLAVKGLEAADKVSQ